MKEVINIENAPKAVGPYSQAIVADNLIFVSGQLPIDPISNEVPQGVVGQTKQSLLNMKHILESVGSGMDKIVKITVLLNNMEDFALMNEIYGSFFQGDYPARICYEVSRLPKDVLVEIDCIAIK